MPQRSQKKEVMGGLAKGLSIIESFSATKPKLSISGILVTRYDPRTVNSREVMARVLERFGDLVFDTVITRTVRFPETSVAGEPITTWAPKSGGAEAYRSLAREVISRFGA